MTDKVNFKKHKTYKVRLLRDCYGCYDQPYGKAGDVID